MSYHSKPIRILVIDPGIREMGFAVFEGEDLIRYGVKNLRKERVPEKILTKGRHAVLDLLQRFSPKVLVMGKITHPRTKKGPVLKKLIAQTKLLARKRKIKTYEYDSNTARESICKDQKPTKRNAAKIIASLYPELSEYIPRERRILWKERDFYRVNVVDACTLAYTSVKKFYLP